MGDKTQSNKEIFKWWGLSHYLARSGLHLVIIASIWFILLSIFKVPYLLKNLISAVFIISYHLLTWPSIPFIRSIIVFILYKLCIFFDLQINSLHLLNLTCFIILLFNPFQLFFLDFQLSFGLTYALIWISSISKKQII